MAKAGALLMIWLAMNMAAGLTTYMFTDLSGIPIFEGMNPIITDTTESQNVVTTLSGSVQPSNTLENKGNLFYRVFDMLNLGFISQLVSVVKGALNGIPKMIVAFFGAYWCDGGVATCPASDSMYTNLMIISSLIYAISALIWWSGRNVTE